jgi:prophage DNA circulation protein
MCRAIVLLAALQAAVPPAGVRAIATVRQLHDVLITPASDAVFAAAGDDTPKTVKAWTAAHDHALLLAEAGNLLMLGNRARDNDRWMKISRALVDAAALAAAAADKHDAKALAAAADSITTACETCHRPYRDNGRQMGQPAR